MAGEQKYDILIDLTQRMDVRPLAGRKEFIQQDALNRLAALLEERLREVVKIKEKKDQSPRDDDFDDDGTEILFDRRHDTITIHGGRGSGKTTFIRNALKHFRTSGEFCNLHGIASLGVVDPTLIENKENVFVVVLNKIKAAVERHRESKGEGREPHSYTACRKKLTALAEGLCLLDGIGPDRAHGDSWDDPQYVLETGLKKAEHGTNLEKRFHELVDAALDYMGKQAFVLAIDDIDTDFARGWPALEVLRRYLTSPRFVVILSGDMDLYAMLVRGRLWDNFAEKQQRYDDRELPAIRKMMDHLQSQYLLKLLRPQNRIMLQSLEYIDLNKDVMVRTKQGDRNLSRFLPELVRAGLGYRWGERKVVQSLLLRQPMRTLLAVLTAFDRDQDRLPESLGSIFLDALLRHDLSPDELRDIRADLFLARVADFLTRRELWSDAHDLLPSFHDDELNSVLMALGAKLREAFERNPALPIQFGLRIGLTHNLLSTRLQNLLPSQIRAAVSYFELDQLGSIIEVSRKQTAAIAVSAAAPLSLGTVQVYNKDAKSADELITTMYGKGSGVPLPLVLFREKVTEALAGRSRVTPTGHWYNTIDSLQRRLPSRLAQALVGLPVARVLRQKGERSTHVSVHALIAAVAEALNAPNAWRKMLDGALIRTYPEPLWTTSGLRPTTEFEVGNEEDVDLSGVEIRDASRPLYESWKKRAPVIDLPPYVVARMWSRFLYTLSNIDDNLAGTSQFLGQLLHRQIVAFFNAVLVEEALYRRGNVAQPKNPITDDRNFLINLNWSIESGVDLSFFSFMFSCPLWGNYLNPESDTFTKYLEASVEPRTRSLAFMVNYVVASGKVAVFPNLFPLLNSVPVVSNLDDGATTTRSKPTKRVRSRKRAAPVENVQVTADLVEKQDLVAEPAPETPPPELPPSAPTGPVRERKRPLKRN